MAGVKTEVWLGHNIRFVEKVPGEWWAVAVDIAKALGYSLAGNMLRKIKPSEKGIHLTNTPGGEQGLSVVSEKGIYSAIMRSRRKEAVDFQEWVYDILKQLRQSTGLEGFEVFRMLDKDHQKEAMSRLKGYIDHPLRVDFIKANNIANKAVSSKYGHPKMLKKGQMTARMLVDRQEILDDTVNLMGTVEKFGLALSVSDVIYGKHVH